MAAGVPVVATDIGPCAEVLDGGKAGLLVPPRDPEALARAIQSVITQPELQARLTKSGIATARARYDSKAAAQRILELLSPSA
jgi:glycosyltransferase involved in cell wall biosynthesis